jgi:predicted DNA-binding transcriptional regulator AlpA
MAHTTKGTVSPPRRDPKENRDPDEKLTLAEVCKELKIGRSTFYDWRAKGEAPECSKLPNGELRILRGELDAWFRSRVA